MDVVIRSSRRPWALDHCLCTLREHAGETLGRVIVVDDRTEPSHLNEVRRRHPNVEVVNAAVRVGSSGPESEEPPFISSWRQVVKDLHSTYFLLLEEDQWLAGSVDLACIESLMSARGIVMVTLNDTGNAALRPSTNDTRCGINVYVPEYVERARKSAWFRHAVVSQFSTEYSARLIRKALKAARVMSADQWLLNYQIYVVTGACFDTAYWLSLWSEPQVRIDERKQLIRALEYACRPDSRAKWGYAESPMVRTSFRSSSSSSATRWFDPSLMNQILSRAWMEEHWNGFVDDADLHFETVEELLLRTNESRASAQHWRDWCESFADHFSRKGFRTSWDR